MNSMGDESRTTPSVAPRPGNGTAVCTPRRIAFIAAPAATEFFALVRNHGLTWDDLARELARIIVAASYDHPALCIIEATQSGGSCFVFGNPEVQIVTARGAIELPISAVSTWYESPITEPLERVEIGETSTPAIGVLFDGVVSADGLVATFGGQDDGVIAGSAEIANAVQGPPEALATVPEPEPHIEQRTVEEAAAGVETLEPEPAAHPTVERVLPTNEPIVDPATADVGPDAQTDQPFDPTLTTMVSGTELSALKLDARNHNHRRPSSPGVTGDTGFERPLLRGVRCPAGHLNSLQDNQCRTCGQPVDLGGPIDTDVRPTLAIVTFDDGTVMELDRPFVLGREVPEPYAIGGETARSISLADPANQISRVHVEIHLSGWDIELIDKGSANGTFTRPLATATTKTRLHTGYPTVIPLGTTVEIGGRSFSITAGAMS